MKPFLLIILFSGYIVHSSAQNSLRSNFSGFGGSLSGKVMDSATGKGVSGASVYIADLKLGAIADESGSYHFANLPTGTYLVEAHAIGHASQIKNVTVTEIGRAHV